MKIKNVIIRNNKLYLEEKDTNRIFNIKKFTKSLNKIDLSEVEYLYK